MRIYEFPTLPIKGQLFHVPGAAVDGGLTSGGARIISPEPGGFSMLELEASLWVNEWEYPSASWLMSKMNGQVFRVRLAPTPQVAWSNRRQGNLSVPWDTGLLWSNQEAWEGDFSAVFAADTLEGASEVTIDLTGVGPILQNGHVIGHSNSCYAVDDIAYDGNVATAVLNPPLRRNVTTGDQAPLRPWFTGSIGNPSEVRAMYEAANNGHIQLGKIVLNESIEP